MRAQRKINRKYQKELLMFCLIAWFSVSPCFAQSQGTPAGQQTQQAPPPTTNSTPSSAGVDTYKQPSSQASVEGATFTYGAEIDFNSNYVWRGLLLDDGPVGQPSAWISAFGFTFTAWGNVAMTSASGGAFEPLPPPPLPPQSNVAMTSASGCAGLKTGGLTLAYNRDWEKLKIEAAIDAYMGQQSMNIGADIEDRKTMESSLKISYPVGPLRISTTHAFDILAYRGSYFGEARLEYQRQVTKNTEFTVSIRSGWASAKFNDVYIGVNKSAFNFVGVEGSLTYYLGSRMYIRPHFEFSSITDQRLRGLLAPSNIANFGIAIGWSK
jgi:hypothetical protein